MKNLLPVVMFVSFVLFPGISIAAKFDMWETGMDINEIVATARQHDIPIASSGVIHAHLKFEQKLLDDRFFKATILEYRTKLGAHSAKVSLKLSDRPKQLYEIEVGIYGIRYREDFLKEMIGTLKQKYGSYRERKDFVFRYYEWRPKEDSQIILRMGSTDASVFYIDPRMKEIVETKKKEKEIGGIRKDGKKF